MLAVAPDVRVPITAIWSAAVFTICSPVSSIVMSGRRRSDTADRSANAQHEVEGVQAVPDGDREHVGPVRLVEHVGIGLAHDAARDRSRRWPGSSASTRAPWGTG